MEDVERPLKQTETLDPGTEAAPESLAVINKELEVNPPFPDLGEWGGLGLFGLVVLLALANGILAEM